MPLTWRLLRPTRNPRLSRPTAPMMTTEPQRHGRLGAAGCSSCGIADYVGSIKTRDSDEEKREGGKESGVAD